LLDNVEKHIGTDRTKVIWCMRIACWIL